TTVTPTSSSSSSSSLLTSLLTHSTSLHHPHPSSPSHSNNTRFQSFLYQTRQGDWSQLPEMMNHSSRSSP
ncbi:hypothetical protein HMI56_005214, partial [Coelomomyces lativittatus]